MTLPPARLPLLALALVALLAALWGGLLRVGWSIPAGSPGMVAFHGPLMVSAFLGTVIGLERAVAVGGRAPYLAPAVTGLGGLALVTGAPAPLGPLLLTLGGVGLCAIFVVIVRRQRALFTATMACGTVAWLVGNALWLAGWPIYRVVPWWLGFLVLTIAGERLELARFVLVSAGSRRIFAVLAAALAAALLLTLVSLDLGMRVAGAAMAALAVWLGGQDVARRTVRQRGLPRFTALCLLSGYAWLGVGGLLAIVHGGVAAGMAYDAMLHAVFLGFVMAMIFGHAPIIFPAVLGRAVPFHARFYVHLALLHASLVLRVAGDLLGEVDARRWGGLLNVAAVALFLASTVAAIAQGSSARGGAAAWRS
ncbi:MAG TPA: hypothetical protein VFJ24_07195 [Gaiellales bacterium]|nr:hypothetical protein [Gaiellales bacterium]